MEQGHVLIRWTRAGLLAKAALFIATFVARPARALEVFEYQLTTQVPTVFQTSQEFYNSNPSEIRGRFGLGPEASWAATTQPATVRFYVDDQHNNQLTRLEIVNYEANLQTFPKPGDQTPGDFNHIRMNVSIDLQSLSTTVLLPANASTTGGLSAQITGNAGSVGTLVASSTVFGNQGTFNVGMESGALLGSFGGYDGLALQFMPGPNGTVRPFFSTWLTIDGMYLSPVTGQLVDYNGLFDMNGYLTFIGAGAAPVPEPDGLMLLALGTVGLLGYGWRRIR